MEHIQKQSSTSFVPYILSILLVCVFGAGVWLYITHDAIIADLRATVAQKDAEIEQLEMSIDDLEEKYAFSESVSFELSERLEEERERNEEFEDELRELSGTIGLLDKLAKTDKELLQKYSKVYFLNEHYTPPKLLPVAKKYLSKPDDVPEYVHAEVEPFLEELLEDAEDDGINLRVLSGYRSFDEQKQLKGTYSVQYGTGANAFSADQGYSEHQLGTTVDFSTEELSGTLDGFGETDAYTWLVRNAHKYGFTLSYPEDNIHYIFEPWHWRFVGEDLAKDLRDDDVHFYDLDQREIDEYLITLFD